MNAERRPSAAETAKVTPAKKSTLMVRPIADDLRQRHDAALRCPPVRDGFGVFRCDPWLAEERTAEPSAFGLRRRELMVEVERCRRSGWSAWELVTRFLDPERVAA